MRMNSRRQAGTMPCSINTQLIYIALWHNAILQPCTYPCIIYTYEGHTNEEKFKTVGRDLLTPS